MTTFKNDILTSLNICYFCLKLNHNRTMTGIKKLVVVFLFITTTFILKGQQTISIGLHADPAFSWFSSDIRSTSSEGTRPGFNFGLTFNKYFAPNYAFSTGISLVTAGGKLTYKDTTELNFNNINSTLLPGDPIVYKINYLSIPVGLKLQTNQIGYITFFSNLGLDPKVLIGGKADVPSLDISNEKATTQLKKVNLSYHITGGIEYSLGGTTALVLGLTFENNFLDVTKDTGDRPDDRISLKMLSFRIGINF